MSLSVKLSDHTWNNDNLLLKGPAFLEEVSDTFKTIKEQWDSAKQVGYYSHNSKIASNRIEILTFKARKRMVSLERAAKMALRNNNTGDAEKLNILIEASCTGRKFLDEFHKKTHFSTEDNQNVHQMAGTSVALLEMIQGSAFAAIPLVAMDMISSNTFASMFQTSWLALGVTVAYKVGNAVKNRLIDAPQERKIGEMQQDFIWSIALLKIKCYSPTPTHP